MRVEEKASESTTVGMSPLVMEERATSADTTVQSTSGAEVTETRGTAEKQRLEVEGNLCYLAELIGKLLNGKYYITSWRRLCFARR